MFQSVYPESESSVFIRSQYILSVWYNILYHANRKITKRSKKLT